MFNTRACNKKEKKLYSLRSCTPICNKIPSISRHSPKDIGMTPYQVKYRYIYEHFSSNTFFFLLTSFFFFYNLCFPLIFISLKPSWIEYFFIVFEIGLTLLVANFEFNNWRHLWEPHMNHGWSMLEGSSHSILSSFS